MVIEAAFEDNDIFQNFLHYYPKFKNKVVLWSKCDELKIRCKMKDGSSYFYDDLYKTLELDSSIDYDDETEWKKEFSRRLKRKMDLKKVSQAWLSKLSGVSRVMLSDYLLGKTLPSAKKVSAIARVLGCSSSDLIDF